ncbi:MAG: Gldg family protein [Clostridia bacterium]|nr:Gldg family protein [Clostridia bacterium]
MEKRKTFRKMAFRPLWFLKRRKFRIGGYSILVTLLVVAIIVLVNVGVRAAEDRWALRLDLSYNSLMKFSERTNAALRDLDRDVVFYVLAAQGREDPQVMEMLNRYSAASRHVDVQVVDPDRNPGLVSAFRSADTAAFGSNTVIVSNTDRSRFKVYSYGELFGYRFDERYQQYVPVSYDYERLFTEAMLSVTAMRTPAVYVLQGHGEVPLSGLAAMQTLLTSNNCDVIEVSLTDEMDAGNGDVILVLSPQKDLDGEERDRIMACLQNGGNMIYVLDVAAPGNLPNFQTLLDYYGVGFDDGMVVADPRDGSQYYPMRPTFLLPKLNDHAITTPLIETNRQGIIIPETRSVKMPEMKRGDFIVTELLLSRPGSYRIDVTDPSRATMEKQAGDAEGPFPLAAAVERRNDAEPDKGSRVVLFGSTPAIAADQMLSSYYNGELLVSTVKWAAKDESVHLSILSKTTQRAGLQIPSASVFYTLGALVVLVVPLAVLATGIVVWLRRRHL